MGVASPESRLITILIIISKVLFDSSSVRIAKMTKPSINFKGDFVQIIDGQSAPTKETRHGLNPANLQEMAKVPVATQQDLDRAVAAAKKAFKTWSKTPYEERRESVLAFADAVDSHRGEFQALLTAEQGKPVGTALGMMVG
jgi:delta 1-pyrroline-5-carboxylate dehydrogenase